MATSKFEKPLKDFLSKFQKDLNMLQKSLKKESDDIVKKVKAATKKDNIQAKRHEVEALIEKNLKKYEPTINKFVHELNSSAKRAGVDLTELEQKVRDNLKTARVRMAKASGKGKSGVTKAMPKVKKAKKTATAAKRPAKRAETPAEVGSDHDDSL